MFINIQDVKIILYQGSKALLNNNYILVRVPTYILTCIIVIES